MRILVLLKVAMDEAVAGPIDPAGQSLLKEFGGFATDIDVINRTLVASGGSAPTGCRTIVFDGPDRTIVDGPCTDDLGIAGLAVWQAADMDEAVARVDQHRGPSFGRGVIEFRPL